MKKRPITQNKITLVETKYLSVQKEILTKFAEMYELNFTYDSKNDCVTIELDMLYTVIMHYIRFAVFRKLSKDVFLQWLQLENRKLDIFSDSLIDYVENLTKE
jgi:hypothetical protein